MSGNTNVTPGYTLATSSPGELVTPAKLNLLGQPVVTTAPGSITSTEIATIDGSVTSISNIPTSALSTATQSRLGGVKNFCPNPQMDEWGNGTSISLQSSGTYVSASGFTYYNAGSITGTISQQPVIAGSSDTYLQNARYWYQFATSSTGATALYPISLRIPNGRTFSGQTITLSAVATNTVGTLPTLSCQVQQYFGTGGSPSATVLTTGSFNAQPTGSTSRIYSTINVPSVSGKTLGTNNDDYVQIDFVVSSASTIFALNVTNIQVELGNSVTSFENSVDRKTVQTWSYGLHSGGRLTLSSGTPVMSANVSTATTLYYTPYIGNLFTVFDKNGVSKTIPFTEISTSIASATTNTLYYTYGYDAGGTLALEWNTTAPTISNGIPFKTGDMSRRCIGAFCCFGTAGNLFFSPKGTDAITNNGISFVNYYNEIPVAAEVIATAAWGPYSTASTWRIANANNNWQLKMVAVKPMQVHSRYKALWTASGSGQGGIALAGNSTTVPDTTCEVGALSTAVAGTFVETQLNLKITGATYMSICPLEFLSSGTSISFTGLTSLNSVNYPAAQLTALITY